MQIAPDIPFEHWDQAVREAFEEHPPRADLMQAPLFGGGLNILVEDFCSTADADHFPFNLTIKLRWVRGCFL
ncbi:hypothetical protein [Sorlinia euscelidii]|uniref:hypothetical protein n=1 Tax=Sorlinia euscelidii TaxID=3081148 RepID=UPI00374DFEB3